MQQASKNIDYNQLGTIYEQSLDRYARKHGGVFYTPNYITEYICKNTIGVLCDNKKHELDFSELTIEKLQTYKSWLLTLKILDPACGSGAFLNATLDFLIAEHKEIDDKIAELTGEKLRLHDTDIQILENNIYGVDINEESVEISKLSLWLRTARKGRALSDLSDNIKCGNSLIDDPEIAGEKAFDWNTEFKQIMDNGGFDVVLGNPPYRIVFETNSKEILENTYPAFRRNNDLYVAFFQKGIQLVNKSGYFSFITPNTYIRGDYFKTLRSELIKKQIVEVIDFGNKSIFPDANVFTAIICLQNIKQHSGWLMKSTLKVEKGYVKANTTNFIARNGLFLKLSKLKKFDNYFLVKDVGYNYWSKGRGKKRGAGSIGDRVFYSGKRKSTKDIPYLKGSQIHKYYNSTPVNFLKHNYKELLEENDTFRFTPEILEKKPKIIYRQTASNLIATIDYNAYHNDKTVHCIIAKKDHEENINLKYVLTLLNSSLLSYYYDVLTEEAGRVFAQVKTVYIKDLPFISVSKQAQQPFIEKADRMLALNKELHEKNEKFIKRTKANFEIQKITKKLQNFYDYDFKVFLSELKKQKINLSLSQQDEWEDYFDNYKTAINKLQTQINQTDNEIDKMVYELYELTAEEIEIVENAVK